MKKYDEEKINKIRSIVKFFGFILFTFGIPLLIYLTNQDIFSNFKTVEDAASYIKSFGAKAVLAYIGIQVFQVVIALIPGQIVEMASGYLYGMLFGCLMTYFALIIGTVIDYTIAKLLGRDFVELVIPKKDVIKYTNMLNSKKGIIICFFLYLIPGFPKDIVSYIAGLSGIDFKVFIIVSTIGRSPGLIGAVAMGALLVNKNYTGFIIIGIIAVLGFFCAFIFKKQINNYIEKLQIPQLNK